VEGLHGAGELVLDVDYILEWLPVNGYQFRIAPAELRFHKVTELRMSLDYAGASAALGPFTLDGIQRDSGPSRRWVLKINWPIGEISFLAAGYTQTLTGEPRIAEQQSLPTEHRSAYIACRDLLAIHPARGSFTIGIHIGQPYRISLDEWACPVSLEGLHSKLHDQHGTDAFQALMLAQNLARYLLDAFIEEGGQLRESSEGPSVDVQRLFKAGSR